jgi:hypothetical protein
MKEIKELKQSLIDIQKKLRIYVFEGEIANKKYAKPLLALKAEVREYLSQNENDIEALRIACYVECYLANHQTGLEYLQKATQLSNDRKDKANVARLSQVVEKFKVLSLSPNELERLGDYLDRVPEACDHSLRFTKIWLEENIDKKKHTKIIKGLQNTGGYCDCEVFANVCSNFIND